MATLFGTTRRKRIISFFLLITLVSEIVTPTATFALTGGPSQPEAQAFTPVSTAEMVDLTSGDFKYNIPLMDVGGYPLNVAYGSGIGMDDEASWTGLGWNMNVGTINRSMRGLPDDFKGEVIEKEFNMKDNNTFGVTVGAGIELFGYQKSGSKTKTKGKLNIGLGISYNNYTGIGVEQSASIGISVSNPAKGSMNASLGMKSSNSGGLTITPNLSFSANVDKNQKGDETTTGSASIGIGMSMNSRAGLKDLSVNASYDRSKEKSHKETDKDGKETGNVIVDATMGRGGTGSSGVIDFGASSYMPRIQNSMVNTSVAVSFKFGATIFGLDGDITLGGYFSNQSLKDPYTSTAAYGYMFSQAGQNADNVLMDFNREKDQSFSRYTKNLPVTNQTYDVFSVTGQGIGGAFRPFRSEVGYVFDNKSTNTSDSYSASGELAAAQTAHLGVNISVVDVNTVAGKWENDNDAKGRLYARHTSPNKDYEPYYFKEVGEKSADDVQGALYNALGGDEAYRIKIDKLIDHNATNEMEKWSGSPTIPVPAANYIPERQKRNQVLSTLNFNEAKQYGLDKKIYNRQYAGNTSMNISTSAKAHHIAEITALRVDGSRYIYGLPAYNTHQEEITFNASSSNSTGNNALTPANSSYVSTSGNVSYNGQDISTGNKKGIDHYYTRVKTPAYAHSYLLTAIVSPDYVDVSDNGPDDGDFGNYTKFEYEKVYNTAKASDKFGWRMPYEAGKANFNESGKSIENDDQGNLVYGEKELWFVKKIITKSYVAVFELADRHDALAAQSVSGGQGSNPTKTKYLKSIALYAKPEYDADAANNYVNAVPIKVVHFVYDYSLCPGVLNNDGAVETVNGTNINAAKGKLTLKEIYFTYGKSDKAKVNKYLFNYGQVLSGTSQLNNFAYHPKAYDRWGNYMPLNNNPTSYTNTSIPTNYAYNTALNNAEFPYVDQFSKAHADYRSSAWNLSRIDLPSGAVIKVNYEADDYAFVQNRPAMQMMKVVGISDDNTIGSTATAGTTGDLYSAFDTNHKKYLFFELTENLNYNSDPAQAKALIAKNYLKDIHEGGKYLYFRFLVNLTNTNNVPTQNTGDHFEYVSGYAELNGETPDCGIVPGLMSNGRQVGFVQLNDVVRDDKTSVGSLLKTNPITKAALNFGKVNYNNLVWDASFSPPSDVVDALKQLASEATGGPFKTIMQAIKGPNNSLMGKKYCQEFVYGKSWIRLYNPNGHKFGGGSRVKSLSINDSWNEMTGGQESSEYGQDYAYETTLNGENISSGVASYEPMLGGDENPFRQPVFMGPNKFTLLVPDERFFMEEPFGETFFPSASVSYSKVKVKNRIPLEANVKTHGTGSMVHEFYTAKDYPTITSHTPINPKQYKPPLGGLLKVMSRDYVSASQGYVIKLNDMHGKQKAQSAYAEGSTTALSKVEYFYKTKGNGYTDYGLIDIHSDARCTPNELDNSCVVIDPKGNIRKSTIGVDFDAVADFRETQTTSVMGGAQINLSVFLVGVFPGIVPSIWPDFSYEKTRFRSAVITKVISQYAVLEKTTAHENGASVTTSNLAFDAQTGDVLVTKTKNDFHDDIYSLKYPAFWGYDLMGPAYKNIGYSEAVNFSSPGVAVVARPDLFQVGDEVSLGGGNKGWVCNVGPGSMVSIMDQGGNLSATGTNVTVKVLRSGRRNLLGSPMASLTSMVNPVDYGNDGLDAKLDVRTSPGKDYKILNTSAIEYSDQWQTFRGYEMQEPGKCTCAMTEYGIGYINYLQTHVFSTTHTPIPGGLDGLNINGTTATYTLPDNCELTFNMNPVSQYHGYAVDWKSMIQMSYFEYEFITDPATCSASIIGTAHARVSYIPELYDNVEFTINGGSNCAPMYSCTGDGSSTVKCGVREGAKVNPFFYGIKGSWRPKTSWSYLEGRKQTASVANNNMDIRSDGTIREYYPFYDIPASGGTWTVTVANKNRWTYTSEVTKITPLGMEVENKDALGRYSSALYGYNSTLPVAVASNAQLQEIAYDGFEDYNFSAVLCNATSQKRHFDFSMHAANITDQQAHSGTHSIKVGPLSGISISNDVLKSECTPQVPPTCDYILSCSDFIYPFAPITANGAKKYIVSYWVKENTAVVSAIPVISYPNSSIGISLSGPGSVAMGTLKKSEIIDGWQRVEQDFTIAALSSGSLNVTLQNSAWSTSYFDDIRIHPFNSNMKSFVYDPVTLKYVAELDANNFATFYEYDEEGSLVRVKKETERGIMTIKETKNHTKLKN
jgi:hypothetical protein